MLPEIEKIAKIFDQDFLMYDGCLESCDRFKIITASQNYMTKFISNYCFVA